MKRREILKTISLLPFSGVGIASADPNVLSAKEPGGSPLSETNIFSTLGDEIKGSVYLGECRTANFVATRNKTKSPKESINIPGGPPLAT